MKNPINPTSPRFLKLREVASILRLDPATVRRLAREGRLAGFRIGQKSFRFRPDDVERFLAASAAAHSH